jgi:hypothetical protein
LKEWASAQGIVREVGFDEFLPDLAFEGLAGVVCVVRVS